MEWYIAEHGRQVGPLSESAFSDMVQAGRVRPDTLVWREGMQDWQPYGNVPESEKPSPDAITASGASPDQAGTGTAVQPEAEEETPAYAVCAECGNTFSSEELVQFGNSYVCANCKPIYVQKMQEGVQVAGEFEYGGFWIRFVAKFLDNLILTIAQYAVAFSLTFIAMAVSGSGAGEVEFFIQFVAIIINFCIAVAYTTFFLGKYGATPGKMAFNLRVVLPDGEPITYMRAMGRHFAEILSYVLCLMGYIIAAFDDEKRTLHDHICSTRVIRRT